jgi:uncharacterized protein YndB with AHSA1/START domain
MNAAQTDQPAVRLTRTIAAPPERVFRAWLDPDVLRRWLAARSMSVTRAEVDERPGGRLSIWQADATGEAAGGFESEIVELVPHERLVFSWRFVGPQRETDPGLDSRLTVTVRPVDGGTELTLVHERLAALRAAMPHVADRVEMGWAMALDKLAAAVGEPSAARVGG